MGGAGAVRVPQVRDRREWDAGQLVQLERRGLLRVGVVVPARDEAATVGDVVAALRRDLVDRLPLADELVAERCA